MLWHEEMRYGRPVLEGRDLRDDSLVTLACGCYMWIDTVSTRDDEDAIRQGG